MEHEETNNSNSRQQLEHEHSKHPSDESKPDGFVVEAND